ncbi:hypothetical protein APR50_11725 [Variovorax paradoxus]|jgi:uncharacterized secreted protein with C-terminal beta-propeller domain|nr:hypothetical protein APR52_06805 [Variovorax paradoxus]MCT8177453.1 hypothetical protein [Variovorax sp. CY25R-8]KPV07657.1 hypothetical protein APR49_17330 [Variovorax paradoxus]KPV08327.1 hypothetical protein APR50_11725 [Variovorax paradoxus]KPV25502.1 hypothetical protein APR51_00120 [Variovorax paradoxus]
MASISQQQNSMAKAKALRAAEASEQRERLRRALPATVELLQQRHADRIDDSDIDAYVNLNWLEWHGGGLRLTITGRNVCAQLAPTALV